MRFFLYNWSMKKQEITNENKSFLVTAYDGGAVFTAAILLSLFLSLVLGVVLIAAGKSYDEEFLSGNLYAFIAFALSPVALCSVLVYAIRRRNLSLKYSAGFVPFDKKYIVIVALLLIGGVTGLSSLNTLFTDALNGALGYKATAISVPEGNFGFFALDVVLICALPAFFEETLFRGLIFNGMKRLGDSFCVLYGGALFALFHHSPVQTVYQFILGVTFCLLALKSGSVYPSMIFHFANNFIVLAAYFIFGESAALPVWVEIIVTVLGVAAFALGLFLLIGCEKPERERELKEKYLQIVTAGEERKSFLLSSAIGVLACVAIWVSELIVGIKGA